MTFVYGTWVNEAQDLWGKVLLFWFSPIWFLEDSGSTHFVPSLGWEYWGLGSLVSFIRDLTNSPGTLWEWGSGFCSMLLLLLSCSVMSDSVRPYRQQPTRLPRPWDSPGKNTGVGCHFLLQCMKVKSESEVTPEWEREKRYKKALESNIKSSNHKEDWYIWLHHS